MGEKGRPLIAGRGKQVLRRDRRGAGPERANTPEPKRKAGVDPAAAQGRGVPSKPSTFSGVVYNGPKPGGAVVREGCMGRHTGMHQALAASYTVHARDLPYQNLAQRGGNT